MIKILRNLDAKLRRTTVNTWVTVSKLLMACGSDDPSRPVNVEVQLGHQYRGQRRVGASESSL